MGAPGAGKGTQAKGIAAHYEIPAISTGDIFRANVKNQTALGKEVQRIMAAGDYVPDEITNAIVEDRLGQPDAEIGFLLDGYPRTVVQVGALDEMLHKLDQELDAVVSLDVDPEVLIARLLKRAELENRADDTEETIRRRMEVYTAETEPLLAMYRERDLLVPVDGMGDVDEVLERIVAALDAKVG